MDVQKILAELRAQKDQLEEAVLSLERLAQGQGKRRGRPPAWLAQAAAGKPTPVKATADKKRVVNQETRNRMAEAQRKRWAAKKG